MALPFTNDIRLEVAFRIAQVFGKPLEAVFIWQDD
jgi:DNA-binding XRE family transcriptional regulator